ncbi:MAG: cell wall-binding repeat-containing protein [Tissierellia bacterium]|nr:cell wall-binding repeat-containing protein [Tissierellia bacterium]
MKSNLKRIFSFVLVLAMILPLFPTRSYANDEKDLLSTKELLEIGLNENDEVDILIETEDEPAIDRRGGRSALSRNARKAEVDVQKTEKRITTDSEKKGMNLEKTGDFHVLITGFSAKVKVKDVDKLHGIRGIKSIQQEKAFHRPVMEPAMNSSVNQVIAPKAWDLGYKGDGMLVAVIDTGVDPNHKDWNVDKMKTLDRNKYDQDKMNQILETDGYGFKSENHVRGKWFNDKVVFGYNYADKNNKIVDTSADGQHGQHVAGTIAAFGKEKGGINGVAPHAQILAMKVFSDDKDASIVFEHVYLEALEDAILLGADAMNMSLGGPAAFYVEEESPISEQVFQKARDHGMVCVVAASNDRNNTYGADYNNLAEHPDVSALGSPANMPNSFAAAAIENSYLKAKAVEYNDESLFALSPFPDKGVVDKKIEYVSFGEPDDFLGSDVNSKIALIDRGKISFNEKYQNAIENGADGVIIVDNVEDAVIPIAMGGVELIDSYPAVSINYADGQKLKAALAKNSDLLVSIPVEEKLTENPVGNEVSTFSSWGPTFDLRMKPDLAAPGGNINSLQNDNTYGNMSGTSMAAPHIAGGSAVVLQALRERGITKVTAEKNGVTYYGDQDDIGQVILLNTADPLLDPRDGATYYTPRQQGAGMMNLEKAVNAPVVLYATGTNDDVKDGKLEIKEVEGSFDATFEIHKLPDFDKDITYRVKVVLLEEEVAAGRFTEHAFTKDTQDLGTITAGESKTFTVDLSKIKTRSYVEGYFFLEASTGEQDNIGVPVLGFKGTGDDGWGNLPFLDKMSILDGDEVNFKPLEGYFGLDFVNLNKDGSWWEYWNARRIDETPYIFFNTRDNPFYRGGVMPLLGVLRSALDVHFDILDKDGNKVLRELHKEPRIIKTGRLYRSIMNMFQFKPSSRWDGTINGTTVPDGEYQYRIKGRVNYPGAKEQEYRYQLILDNIAPTLIDNRYEDGKVHLTLKDDFSGLAYVEVQYLDTNNKIKTVRQYLDEYALDVEEKEITLAVENAVAESMDDFAIYVEDFSSNAIEISGEGYVKHLDIAKMENLMESAKAILNSPDDFELNDESKTKEEVLAKLTEKVNELKEKNFRQAEPKELEKWLQELEDLLNLFIKIDSEGSEKPDQDIPEEIDQESYEYPNIAVKEPGYYEAFNQKRFDKETREIVDDTMISLKGTITQIAKIDELVAYFVDGNNNEIEGTRVNLETNVPEDHNELHNIEVEFNGKMDIQDMPEGILNIKIALKGRDPKGKEVYEEVIRRVRKDITPVELKLKGNPLSDTSPYGRIIIDAKENMNYFEVYINDNLVLRVDRTWENLLPEEVTGHVERIVDLPEDENEFTIAAYDDAGNETIETLIINRPENAKNRTILDELLKMVEKAQDIRDQYSEYVENDGAFDALKEGIKNATSLLEQEDTTDEEARKMINELDALIKQFQLKDKEALKDELNKLAEKGQEILDQKNKYDYSEEDLGKLEELMGQYNNLGDHPSAKELEDLIEGFEELLPKFKEKPNKPKPIKPKPTPGSGGNDYPITTPEEPHKDKDKDDLGQVKVKGRIAGKDRIDTAIAISKKVFNKADNIVLAGSYATPDALTSGPLAKASSAPILLTGSDQLDNRTLSEIERLGAKKVYIAGGNASVSEKVEKKLKEIGLTVERFAGKDRFETSLAIAERVVQVLGVNDAYVANGISQADALTASPAAAKNNSPILLTDGQVLVPGMEKITGSAKTVYAIGGNSSISANLAQGMTRVSGKDRYATSVEIAKKFIPSDEALLASGTVFVDALSASPLAVYLDSPVLLTLQNKTTEVVKEYIDENVNSVYLIGGTATLSNQVILDITQ